MRKASYIAVLVAALLPAAAHADLEDDYMTGKKAWIVGDFGTAMTVLRKAADEGHAKSQALYAEILDKSEFDEEARVYFRKAADQGEADGEFGLAVMLSNGEGGGKDEAEALKLLKSAAGKGHKPALNVLSAAYVQGHLGLDDAARGGEEALKWIRAAADAEDAPSLRALAEAYRKGSFGLTPDPKRADELVAKALKVEGTKEGRRRRK